MTTQNMASSDFTHYRTVKTEYDNKPLNHRCPKCPMRCPTSSKLIQHMNEEHSAFVTQTESMITRAADKMPMPFKNTIATCPWCHQDFQTRKKFMMHLQTAHKDDEEPEEPRGNTATHKNISNRESEEPRVKVIRIDGSFVTPGASESSVVQGLLAAIGSTNSRGLANGSAKLDNKSATKLQYRCFWCDASFRKRGKLMDHIDTLHKHNKDKEAERQNIPTETSIGRSDRIHMGLQPTFLPTVPSMVNQHRLPRVDNKPSGGNCSFTLAGSLSKKSKPTPEDSTPPNICKFYLSKKDNPLLVSKKASLFNRTINHPDRRRGSLPLFEDGGSSSFTNSFQYGLLSSMTAAAAMQQSHWSSLGIRSPLHPFYAPRMPMILPTSEYLVNHAQPSLDQLTASQRAQLSRMTAINQMSPLTTSRSKTSSESPLDLTKSYNI